jgi:hypothetical protein
MANFYASNDKTEKFAPLNIILNESDSDSDDFDRDGDPLDIDDL